MKKAKATALFLMLGFMAYGLHARTASILFEVLMSKKTLSAQGFDAEFIRSVDITADRLLLLSTQDHFYALGWGGIAPIGKIQSNRIDGYAITFDNQLLVVSRNAVCRLDPKGIVTQLYKLPNEGMGISAGKKVMYFFDRNRSQQRYSLYLLAKGGRYAKLFDLPTPINSVAEMNGSLLFASANGLFAYDLRYKKVKPLAAVTRNQEIESIAVDASCDRIFFSTDEKVYAIQDSRLVLIVEQFGGMVRFFDRGLIIFNPQKKLLIRIVDIENEFASAAQAVKNAQGDLNSGQMLTNFVIVNWVKAGLADDRIIQRINRSRVDFNLSVDAMVELAKQNVSSTVIMAMKKAMKKQAATTP